jgi:hypothetical protein
MGLRHIHGSMDYTESTRARKTHIKLDRSSMGSADAAVALLVAGCGDEFESFIAGLYVDVDHHLICSSEEGAPTAAGVGICSRSMPSHLPQTQASRRVFATLCTLRAVNFCPTVALKKSQSSPERVRITFVIRFGFRRTFRQLIKQRTNSNKRYSGNTRPIWA